MMNKFLSTSDSSFFPELVIISHSQFEMCYLFFSGVPSSNYHGDPSKSLQGFTLCFPTPLSFRYPFVTGVLHEGST